MKTTTFMWLTACLIALLPLSGKAQNGLFEKYSDMKDVTSVYISKAMIANNSQLFTKDIYIGKVKGQINSIQILSSMNDNVKADLRKDIRLLLKKHKYELLMKKKSGTSNAEFYMLRNGEKVSEFLMILDGVATFKYLFMEGEMTVEDIQRIMMIQSSRTSGIERINRNGVWLTPGTPEFDAAMRQVQEKMKRAKEKMDTLEQGMKQYGDSLKQLEGSLKKHSDKLAYVITE